MNQEKIMLQATQRLMIVPSESKNFDCCLKYAPLPYQTDIAWLADVGKYDGAVIGDCVAIILLDGRTAYTDAGNVR